MWPLFGHSVDYAFSADVTTSVCVCVLVTALHSAEIAEPIVSWLGEG